MVERDHYVEACRTAATRQGLDPIVLALTAAGVDHQVEQTGGFCMVVTLPIGRTSYLGITASEGRAGGDQWLVVRYEDEEDEGVMLLERGDTATVLEVIRDATSLPAPATPDVSARPGAPDQVRVAPRLFSAPASTPSIDL